MADMRGDQLAGSSGLGPNPGEALPSYPHGGSNDLESPSLCMQIVDHPRVNRADQKKRTITVDVIPDNSRPMSQNFTRAYIPTFMGLTKFTIYQDEQSPDGLAITFIPGGRALDYSGRLVWSYNDLDETPTAFTLKDAYPSKTRFVNANSLLERMVQVGLEFRVMDAAVGKPRTQAFTWRAVTSGRRPSLPVDESRRAEKAPAKQSTVDLVLLDENFREYAYLENNFDPSIHLADCQWGTLTIKQGMSDALLVDQIILSALALMEVHMQVASRTGKWSTTFGNVWTGVVCSVM